MASNFNEKIVAQTLVNWFLQSKDGQAARDDLKRRYENLIHYGTTHPEFYKMPPEVDLTPPKK